MARMHNPAHPGAILAEWLDGLQVTDVAEHLGISRQTLSRILNERAGISADMDLRLSDALGTTPGLWLGLQAQYDLWQAAQKTRQRIAPIRHAA